MASTYDLIILEENREYDALTEYKKYSDHKWYISCIELMIFQSFYDIIPVDVKKILN